ncbi:hypothetical protein Poly51_03010 [Rubripirellula tenax]|uniref:Uncharacterized protein n=1 Tax=Rubripirellula tenax TaxID=2528015 RepID=A0A5C6FIW3_9BACT|nr:hypothetical protein [Rubripirellula tenax]TWU60027.1 hypothetical protein Poly51_03010 [Rubripirellula tenax]
MRHFFVGLLVTIATSGAVPTIADDTLLSALVTKVSIQDPIAARLSAPMTAIVDGLPLRAAIDRLTGPAQVNVCLSRDVDPTTPIQLGPVGPTSFAAIRQVAQSVGCEVDFVAGVVVIGKATWIDGVASRLSALPTASPNAGRNKKTDFRDIGWDRLATPTEAIALASGETSTNELIHDLWPETRWIRIDRSVAVTLVRSQIEPPPPAASLTRSYQSSAPGELRASVESVDSRAKARMVDGNLVVQASPAAHRAAVFQLLGQPPAGRESNDAPYSLKSTTSARNALTQLSQAAGRTCVIEPSAADACEAIISIEEKDVTLKVLIERVAILAGVTIQWNDKTVVVTREGN